MVCDVTNLRYIKYDLEIGTRVVIIIMQNGAELEQIGRKIVISRPGCHQTTWQIFPQPHGLGCVIFRRTPLRLPRGRHRLWYIHIMNLEITCTWQWGVKQQLLKYWHSLCLYTRLGSAHETVVKFSCGWCGHRSPPGCTWACLWISLPSCPQGLEPETIKHGDLPSL